MSKFVVLVVNGVAWYCHGKDEDLSDSGSYDASSGGRR